jgi:hypothetical protein
MFRLIWRTATAYGITAIKAKGVIKKAKFAPRYAKGKFGFIVGI